MKTNNAPGAEFLKRLGIIILIIGVLASIIMIFNSLEDGSLLFAAVGVLVSSLITYGICINIANINDRVNQIYLMRLEEFKKAKSKSLDEVFDFKEE